MAKNKTDWGTVLVSGLGFNDGVGDNPVNLQSFLSDPVKGDGLVHKASGYHTFQIHTINFNGNISILATSDAVITPNTDWIPIQLTNTVNGNTANIIPYVFIPPVPGVPYSSKTIERNDFYTASGQYAWLRANITDITAGDVPLIKLSF